MRASIVAIARGELLARCFLNDFDPAAGTNTRSPHRDHSPEIGQRADATRRLHAQPVRFHDPCHQRNVRNCRATRVESGGCFHEIRARFSAELARADFLGIVE